MELQGALHPKAEGTRAGGSGSQSPGAREALQSRGSAAAGAPRSMMRPGLQVSEKKLEPETKSHCQDKSHCSYWGCWKQDANSKEQGPLLLQPCSLPIWYPRLAEPNKEPAGNEEMWFAESQWHKALYRRVGVGLGDNSWMTYIQHI